jgi:hypothetical protein
MFLLRAQNFIQYYGILYGQGAWYITHNSELVQGTSPGVPLQPTPILDYTSTIQGTVVPQRRWAPADGGDIQRHVQSATLELPIFFVNRNGGLGFQLTDILRGCDRDLRNANEFASLGGKTMTHIRINWPGYKYWKRQISARDETHARNSITMGRFMKRVGASVDKFCKECMSNGILVPDPRWRIGAGGITQQNVIVIGAINVSAGSWMPILQLNGYVI